MKLVISKVWEFVLISCCYGSLLCYKSYYYGIFKWLGIYVLFLL